MKKIKISKVPADVLNFHDSFKNKYENLFGSLIISRGVCYYSVNKIIEFKEEENCIEAIVEGSKKYKVKVKLSNDLLTDVYCSCPYHESNIYCKHISAVLYKKHMDFVLSTYKNVINDNVKIIKKVIKEIKKIINDNEKFVKKTDKKDILKELKKFTDFISNMNLNATLNDIKILDYQIESKIERIIKYYDEVIEYIDRRKEEKEQRRLEKLEEKRLEQECLEEDDADDEYDPIIARIEAYMESIPLEVLEKVRAQVKAENGDTSNFDKAIQSKKQKEIKNNNKGLFSWLISSLFSSKKNTTDKDYEDYNFEEEELEEDDFHYDDLD